MKKIVPVLFALVLAFSLAACKEQKTIVKGGTASLDEILAYTKEKAQEDSTNVTVSYTHLLYMSPNLNFYVLVGINVIFILLFIALYLSLIHI